MGPSLRPRLVMKGHRGWGVHGGGVLGGVLNRRCRNGQWASRFLAVRVLARMTTGIITRVRVHGLTARIVTREAARFLPRQRVDTMTPPSPTSEGRGAGMVIVLHSSVRRTIMTHTDCPIRQTAMLTRRTGMTTRPVALTVLV